MDGLRSIRADNPGPFTLSGTRTWILGVRRVAVIDPGPDVDDHVGAVVESLVGAHHVTVVLTHGHPDHTGAVDALLRRMADAPADASSHTRPDVSSDGAPGVTVVGSGHPAARPLAEGERVETDAGDLVCVPTPGHTRDHLAFHHPEWETVFAGDLVLGSGDTTWVAEYPGCVADYLASLDRIEALAPRSIHPSHGPIIEDPGPLLRRYRAHREARIAAVKQVRSARPRAGFDEIYRRIYGDSVPNRVRSAAEASLRALLHHVDTAAGQD